jgi:1,4-alpha-glucan branching enzyme
MIELARERRDETDPLTVRALNQATRELLLAQSSDWAFIMKTGTAVQYAVKRTRDHVGRFAKLRDMIRDRQIDETWLADIEGKDNIFPEIDYRVYAEPAPASAIPVGLVSNKG